MSEPTSDPTQPNLAFRWEWPTNSRKAHLFPADEVRSLCGKWMLLGHQEQPEFIGKFGPDDCAACRKKWEKSHD